MEGKKKLVLVNMPVLKEKLREREAFLLARQQNPMLKPEDFLVSASKTGSEQPSLKPDDLRDVKAIATPSKSKAAIQLSRMSKASHKRPSRQAPAFPVQRAQVTEEVESDPFIREFKVMADKLEHRHKEALMDIKIERVKKLREEAKLVHESEKQEVDKIILRRMKASKSVPLADPASMATTASLAGRANHNVSLTKLFRVSQMIEPSKRSFTETEGTTVFFRMNRLAENILPKSFINDSLQVIDSAGRTIGSENQITSVGALNSNDTKKLQIIFDKRQLQRSVVTPSTPSTSPFLLRTAKVPGAAKESFRVSTVGNQTLSMLESLREPGAGETGWSHRYQNGSDSLGTLTERAKFPEHQNSRVVTDWRLKETSGPAMNKSISMVSIGAASTFQKNSSRPKLEKISDSVMQKLRVKMQERQQTEAEALGTRGSQEVQFLEKAGFPVFTIKDPKHLRSRYTTRDRANIHGGTIRLNQPPQVGLMGKKLPFPVQIFKKE